jgi:hypothetical protein
VGKGKGKAKTAAGQVKVIPKRPPYRCTCNVCGMSWVGGLLYNCGHDDYVEKDI